MSKKKFLSAAKSGFGFVRPLAYRPPSPAASSVIDLPSIQFRLSTRQPKQLN